MPFTISVTLSQSPAHVLGAYPAHDLKVDYEEDVLVGYRWFDAKGIVPQFAFESGMSYTTFAISNATTEKKEFNKVDKIVVKVNVKNSGKTIGAELVQLYSSQTNCSVLCFKKELKAFDKVFLAPGEQKTEEMKVKVKDLAFYDEKSSSGKLNRAIFFISTHF